MTSQRERTEELLSEYREQTLDTTIAAELEAYLTTDAECRELLMALDEVADAMPRLPEVMPPAGLARRAALAALSRSHSRGVTRAVPFRPRVMMRRQPAYPPLLQAAAAIAMVVTGVAGLVSGPEAGPAHVATQVVERTSLELRERTDLLVENVRAFGLSVGAAVETRFEGIHDRVDEYRDLLERPGESLPVEGRGFAAEERIAKNTQLPEPNGLTVRYNWMKAGAGDAVRSATSSLSAWREA
jgi:hypothetical protein